MTPSPDTRLDDGVAAVVGLAWAAGLIHVQAAIGHFGESVLVGILFALVAICQFAWGGLVYRDAAPRLLWLGAIVSVCVAGGWLMSRTVGLPIGADPWVPESVGLIDVLATLDELFLAAAVAVHVLPARRRVGGVLRATINASSIVLLLLSALVLAGLQGHVH